MGLSAAEDLASPVSAADLLILSAGVSGWAASGRLPVPGARVTFVSAGGVRPAKRSTVVVCGASGLLEGLIVRAAGLSAAGVAVELLVPMGVVSDFAGGVKGRVSDGELEGLLRAAVDRAPTAEMKAKLRALNELRNKIVHGSPQTVAKSTLKNYLAVMRTLAQKVDEKLRREVRRVTGANPW